jgi:predicted lipase
MLVTGHSLGGAMATLAALDIYQLITPVDNCILFASPHLGNSEFAQYFDKIIPNTIRITNGRGIVSNTPLNWIGYHHVG